MQTVYHKGMGLTMQDSAMVELGWKNGQTITEAQMWEGIEANARSFCRAMDARRTRGEEAPDTASLAEMCGHRPVA